jgi:hypothetical protein
MLLFVLIHVWRVCINVTMGAHRGTFITTTGTRDATLVAWKTHPPKTLQALDTHWSEQGKRSTKCFLWLI